MATVHLLTKNSVEVSTWDGKNMPAVWPVDWKVFNNKGSLHKPLVDQCIIGTSRKALEPRREPLFCQSPSITYYCQNFVF
jgi:hypothetical protein